MVNNTDKEIGIGTIVYRAESNEPLFVIVGLNIRVRMVNSNVYVTVDSLDIAGCLNGYKENVSIGHLGRNIENGLWSLEQTSIKDTER